jgi:uncharacterized protein
MSRDRAQWLEVAPLVARNASVDVRLALADLPRMAPLLRHSAGEVTGQLRFHRLAADVGTAAFDAAEGELSATLLLTCQRCLEEVAVAVVASCHLGFVDDEAAAAAVPATHDPVIMTQGRVSLTELVEEELLLALPIVPVHADTANCVARPADRADEEAPKAEPTHRPFAGLRDLLKK